ncbi:E3 SUMO-protein ligase NSE2-like [Trachemys scripta elegans]|uniref:E3 SUMO-protein ligase NSE2-like n=1 Tax=Trachemys scripta elegans TaxID=31138 RepID=UPI001551EBF8|nr:E3 SUMO-protein ligase NSE2-like [Trachemys scripta elegans]
MDSELSCYPLRWSFQVTAEVHWQDISGKLSVSLPILCILGGLTENFSLRIVKPALNTYEEEKEHLIGPRSDTDANESIEQIDEDIAVTQSQMNFICPITQMEMQKPVRNKVCGHTYEEEAILKIIQRRENQKKKACCPKIGCSHLDVKRSDLVPDEALKRAIDSQNKQARSMP